MSIEHLSPSPEYNEHVLFEQRLPELQQELADGRYGGETVYFLAGLEREVQLIEPAVEYDQIFETDEKIKQVQDELETTGSKMLTPSDESLTMLRLAEGKVDYNKLYAEAYATIDALQPTNSQEAAKKQKWLQNIATFTKVDYVNFQLYCEFSTPTLGDTAPEKGAAYDQLSSLYDQPQKWVEFRFGNGILQDGYYDNPGIVELRLSPCPPDELVAREKIVMERLAAIAAEHNVVGVEGGSHINLSMYAPGANGDLLPVIGTQPERRAATLDIVTGLSAGIEQGAWMHDETARDRLSFGPVSAKRAYSIGQERTAIRLQDDIVELRDPRLKASTSHGLLWMMAAMSYGRERGMAELGTQHTPAEEIVKGMVERTSGFDKEVDLQLQRTIEEAKLNEVGTLTPTMSNQRSQKFVDSIFGEGVIDGRSASLIDKGLVGALVFDAEGRLSLDHATFKTFYVQAVDTFRTAFGEQLPRLNMQMVTDKIDVHLGRDAVRLKKDIVVGVTPTVPGEGPYRWSFLWIGSQIRNRAFGRLGNSEHSTQLEETLEQYYIPVDMSDAGAVITAVQAHFRRAAEVREQQHGNSSTTMQSSEYYAASGTTVPMDYV